MAKILRARRQEELTPHVILGSNANEAEVEINIARALDLQLATAELEDLWATVAPYITDAKHRAKALEHYLKVAGSLHSFLHDVTTARALGCVKQPSEAEDGTGGLYDAKA